MMRKLELMLLGAIAGVMALERSNCKHCLHLQIILKLLAYKCTLKKVGYYAREMHKNTLCLTMLLHISMHGLTPLLALKRHCPLSVMLLNYRLSTHQHHSRSMIDRELFGLLAACSYCIAGAKRASLMSF